MQPPRGEVRRIEVRVNVQQGDRGKGFFKLAAEGDGVHGGALWLQRYRRSSTGSRVEGALAVRDRCSSQGLDS